MPANHRGSVRRLLTATAAATALLAMSSAPAWADAGSAYGQWTISGGQGTLQIPVVGFPDATVTTDSSGPAVQSGASTFLNSTTPFGSVYGSSQNRQYLFLRPHGSAPSTTTIRFTGPTPVGWGFALGDIDADKVQVSGTGPGGTPLTTAQLGWQDSFNFCNGVTPRPSTCMGRESTDRPVWDPATATLTGNGPDTNGASGWFRPTVPVASLTFVYSLQSGSPIYQLWAASEVTSITGSVRYTCPPADQTVLELWQNGSPVVDRSGAPVTTTLAGAGSFTFGDLAPGQYQVRLRVDGGYLPNATSRDADTSSGTDAGPVNFMVRCPAPVVDPPITIPPGGSSIDIPIERTITKGPPVVITDPPANGTVVEKKPGTLTYTPKPGFSGTDSFVYTGKTPAGRIVAVKVTVKVPPRPARHRAHRHLAELAATGTQPQPWLLGAAALAATAAGGVLLLSLRSRPRGR